MSRANDLAKISQRLIEDTERHQGFPLLLLPSTPAAFSVVAQCIDAGLPMTAVANALCMKEWEPTLFEHVHSPLSLWRLVKDSPVLPFGVACFQDQLANIDESFHAVTVDDQRIRVSPIDAMLIMRFRPHTLVATATEGRSGKPSLLSFVTYEPDISDNMSTTAFDEVLGEMLRPILKCQSSSIRDWHARELFALKLEHNFERALSQRLQEIESLIRVYEDRHGNPSSLASSLDLLRVSRQTLVRHIR